MEYASGGELFERICNAGRFSEDEVFVQALLFVCHYFYIFIYGEFTPTLCCRHVSSSSNLYQESATVMLWYVKNLYEFLESEYLYLSRPLYSVFILVSTWSKYVTATWNWRTHYLMAAQHLGWKFVILDILRFDFSLFQDPCFITLHLLLCLVVMDPNVLFVWLVNRKKYKKKYLKVSNLCNGACLL